MTHTEYEYLQIRLRRKLDDRKPAGMTGKRGEGYETGIRAAMSIVKEIYTTRKGDIELCLTPK